MDRTTTREREWNAELDLFKRATANGSLPKGTKTAQSMKAIRYEDRYGVPYRADAMMNTYIATSNEAKEKAQHLGEMGVIETREAAGVKIPDA